MRWGPAHAHGEIGESSPCFASGGDERRLEDPDMAGESRETQGLFDLSGRIAIITGGAGGLGRAVAKGLAAAGAVAVVADLDLSGA